MNTPVYRVKRFSDFDIQARGDLLNVSRSKQDQLLQEEGANYGILPFLGNKAGELKENLFPSSPMLSQEEANEAYGVGTDLQFEGPIREATAKERRKRFANHKTNQYLLDIAERDDNFFDGLRNFANTGAAAMIADAPLMFLEPLALAAEAGNALKGISAVRNSTIATKAIQGLGEIAHSTTVLGMGATKTGLFRGAANNVLAQALTESAVLQNAKENGYDYDWVDSLQSVLFAAGLGGALGALGNTITFNRHAKAFGPGLDDIAQGLNQIIETRALTQQGLESLNIHIFEQMSQGKTVNPSVFNALLRLDAEISYKKPFVDAVNAGLYDDVFPRSGLEDLQKMSSKEAYDFITQVKFKSRIVAQIKKVSGLDNKMLEKLDEIIKNTFVNKKPMDMEFKEFRDEITSIQKSLKGKRVVKKGLVPEDTEVKQFFNLKSKTQGDIARLYQLLNPAEEIVWDYEEMLDIIKYPGEDFLDLIKQSYYRHQYFKDVLSEFDNLENAKKVIKDSVVNPDGDMNTKLAELSDNHNKNIQKKVDLPGMERDIKNMESTLDEMPESLKAEIEKLEIEELEDTGSLQIGKCLLGGSL